MTVSKKASDLNRLITPEYAALMKREMDAAEAKLAELENVSKKSRQTLWRATRHEDATVKGCMALRDALTKVTGKSLPPPIVAISDQADYDWYEAGQLLKTLDIQKFTEVLGELKELVSAKQGDQRASSKLRGMMHATTSDPDDTKH